MGCLGSRAGTSSRDVAFAVAGLVVAADARVAGGAFRVAAGSFAAVVAARGAGAALGAAAAVFGAGFAFVAALSREAGVVLDAARDGETTGSKIRQARNAAATA